jgi:hypothetical protein
VARARLGDRKRKKEKRDVNYADLEMKKKKKKIGEEIPEEGQGLIKRGVFFSVGVKKHYAMQSLRAMSVMGVTVRGDGI